MDEVREKRESKGAEVMKDPQKCGSDDGGGVTCGGEVCGEGWLDYDGWCVCGGGWRCCRQREGNQ